MVLEFRGKEARDTSGETGVDERELRSVCGDGGDEEVGVEERGVQGGGGGICDLFGGEGGGGGGWVPREEGDGVCGGKGGGEGVREGAGAGDRDVH